MTDTRAVLVSGATGRQGGAVVAALRAAGTPVRALVRDPRTERAARVADLGAELVTGDLDDRESLVRAVAGTRAVFSVQLPDLGGRGFAGEVSQAVNLIEAARVANVPQLVHSSVSGAGQHTEVTGWAEGRWAALEPYFSAKAEIQDRVRAAGFRSWTILKPGFFMENFLPSMAFLFPRGVEGGLVSVLKPDTHVSLVAVDDIGVATAAAVADPRRFHQVELELASDYLTMTEIAEVLSDVLGTRLNAPDLTREQATAAGMPAMGAAHERMNVVGHPARPEHARALGLPTTTFRAWANRYLRPDADRRP